MTRPPLISTVVSRGADATRADRRGGAEACEELASGEHGGDYSDGRANALALFDLCAREARRSVRRRPFARAARGCGNRARLGEYIRAELHVVRACARFSSQRHRNGVVILVCVY